jgi:hypothetical protein
MSMAPEHDIYVSAPPERAQDALALCRHLEERGLRCWTPLRDWPFVPRPISLHLPALEQARAMLILDANRRTDRLLPREMAWARARAVPIIDAPVAAFAENPAALVARIEASLAQKTAIRLFVYAPEERRQAEVTQIRAWAIALARALRDRVRYELLVWGETDETPGADDIVALVFGEHDGPLLNRELSNAARDQWLHAVDKPALVTVRRGEALEELSTEVQLDRLADEAENLFALKTRWLAGAHAACERWHLAPANSTALETEAAGFAYHLRRLTWAVIDLRLAKGAPGTEPDLARSVVVLRSTLGQRRPETEGIGGGLLVLDMGSIRSPRRPSRRQTPGPRPSGDDAPPELPPPRETRVEKAHFAVFAPPFCAPVETFLLQVWACTPDEASYEAMRARATARTGAVEVGRKDAVPAPRGTWLTVRVNIPGLEVPEPTDRMFWDGDTVNVSFAVSTPGDVKKGPRLGTAVVFAGEVPLTRITFRLLVGEQATAGPVELDSEQARIRNVFASYASADRAEVLRFSRAARALEVDVFVDVLSLREGQDWSRRMFDEVPARDLFCLFWSRPARESTWVEKEWRCALAARGLDYIHPMALADPRDVPPPPELSTRHFGDALRVLIAAEDARKAKNPKN